MKLIFVIACVFLMQINAFYIEERTNKTATDSQLDANADDKQKKIFQETLASKSDDVLEILTKCLFAQIIEGMQYVLEDYINNNNDTINHLLAINIGENPLPTNLIPKQVNYRQKRATQDPDNWNKCVLKSEFDKHSFTENNHFSLIKQELAKLQQLVRLLQDQQYVLNILNDMSDNSQPKSQHNKELVEFLDFLKTYQAQNANTKPENRSDDDGIELSIEKLTSEVARLKQMMERNEPNATSQLKQDFEKQKQALEELQKLITNMQNLKNVPIHLNNPDDPNLNVSEMNSTILRESEAKVEQIKTEIRELEDVLAQATPQNYNDVDFPIVGEPLIKTPKALLGNLKPQPGATPQFPKLFSRENSVGPKARAEDNQFLDGLQKLFGISDPNTESKELNSNNLDLKLQDLEREIKLASKVHSLQKQLKVLQDSTESESKTLDEDDDIKVQLRKIQRQIKNLHKTKPQKKDLDEEDDLQDRLKELQTAIDNLKPKEGGITEGKDGATDFQSMLGNLLNFPPAPVQSVPQIAAPTFAQQHHLTPAQIQLLRMKILSMNKPTTQGLQHGSINLPVLNHGADGILSNGNSGTYGYANQNPYGIAGPYGIGNQALYGQLYDTNSGYDLPTAGQYQPYGKQNGYSQSRYQVPSYKSFAGASDPYALTSGYGYNFGPNLYYGLASGYVQPVENYNSLNIPYGSSKNGPYFPERKQYEYIKGPTQYGGSPYGPFLNRKIGHSTSNYPTENNKQTIYQRPPYKKPGNNNNYDEPSLSIHDIFENLAQSSDQEPVQFFPGHEKHGYHKFEDEAYKPTDYAGISHAEKPYSNPQQNPSSSPAYPSEKVDDLKTQIYGLESVINNLSSPEYIQKPEDQETVYNLDRKISDLKDVVNNLSQDTPQNPSPYPNSPSNVNSQQENYRNSRNTDQIETNTQRGNNVPLPSQGARRTREVNQNDYNSNNIGSENKKDKNIFDHVIDLIEFVGNISQVTLAQNASKFFMDNQEKPRSFLEKMLNFHYQPNRKARQTEQPNLTQNKTKDGFSVFLQQMSDLFELYMYVSQNLEHHNNSGINNETFSHTIKRHIRQISQNEEMMNVLMSKINFIMYSLNHITHELLNKNCSCTESPINVSQNINLEETPPHIRQKRQLENKDENDSGEAVAAMASFFKDVFNEVREEEKSTPQMAFKRPTVKQRNAGGDADGTLEESLQDQEFEINQHKLKQKLADLKKQLAIKMRLNNQQQSLSNQQRSAVSHNTMQRSKGGGYYQQPSYYYQKPQYFQPYAYQINDYAKPQYTSYEQSYDTGKKEKFKVQTTSNQFLDKAFGKIVDKIVDKVVYAIPRAIRRLLSMGLENLLGFGSYDYGYDNNYDKKGYDQDYSVQKGYGQVSLFAYLPMLIIKVLTNIASFVKYLKKNTFIRTFLVPGAITAIIPGLIIFLVWWLTGDESFAHIGSYQDSYGSSGYSGGSEYNTGYGGNEGYSKDYNTNYRSNNAYDSNYRPDANNYANQNTNPANNMQNAFYGRYNYVPHSIPPNRNQNPVPNNQNLNFYNGYDVNNNYAGNNRQVSQRQNADNFVNKRPMVNLP